MNELRMMLLDAVENMNEMPIFRYPISAGFLMRSSIEQALKVCIKNNGGEFGKFYADNEKTIVRMLADGSDESSKRLKVDLETLMNNDIRNKLNDIVHTPADVKDVENTNRI